MVQGEFTSGMNPGMILRLEEKSIDASKRAMQEFLPHYINMDMKLPLEFEYEFGLFFQMLVWKAKWTNIEYEDIKLDIEDVKVEMTRPFGKPLVKVKFPAIKHW